MTADLMLHRETFDTIVMKAFAACEQLLVTKGGEYAGDNNRLENFVRNAKAIGVEPEIVLFVYAAKHWDAIVQYWKDTAAGVDRPRSEPIGGRMDDLINYMLLAKGMVHARTDYELSVTVDAPPRICR